MFDWVLNMSLDISQFLAAQTRKFKKIVYCLTLVMKIENIILNNEAYYFLQSHTQFLLKENHNPRKKYFTGNLYRPRISTSRFPWFCTVTNESVIFEVSLGFWLLAFA